MTSQQIYSKLREHLNKTWADNTKERFTWELGGIKEILPNFSVFEISPDIEGHSLGSTIFSYLRSSHLDICLIEVYVQQVSLMRLILIGEGFKMKFLAITSVFVISIMSSVLHAEEFGTAADAEAMVKKAIEHIKTAGVDSAYADFTSQSPDFIKNDVYVVVYSMGGKALAHGQNPKQVGKDLIDFKDADGKEFVKERVQLAQSKGKFWQDYKFTDPVTKKILPKSAYCEKLDETIVCAGIYKR